MNGLKAADIRREIEKEIEELAHETDRARKDERVKAYLEFCSQFHNYSAQNTWWLGWQCAARSMAPIRFSGLRTWNKMNRLVRRGSSAFQVLKPCQGQRTVKKRVQDTYNDPETGQQVSSEDEQEDTVPTIYFIPVNVFDLSQTVVMDGKEDGYIPQELAYGAGGDASRVLPLITTFAETVASVTEVGKDVLGEALGCTDGNTIKVLETLPPAVKCETYIHEVAHVLLKHRHSDLGKSTRECEAASVAYIVTKRLGLEPGGARYLALWDQEPRDIMVAMDRVLKVTESIVDALGKSSEGDDIEEQAEEAVQAASADVLTAAMAEIATRRAAEGNVMDEAYKRYVAVDAALAEIVNGDVTTAGGDEAAPAEYVEPEMSENEAGARRDMDSISTVFGLFGLLGIGPDCQNSILDRFSDDLYQLAHLMDFLLKESKDSKNGGYIMQLMDELGYSPEFQCQLAYSRLGQIDDLEQQLYETSQCLRPVNKVEQKLDEIENFTGPSNLDEKEAGTALFRCLLCGRELPETEFANEPEGEHEACNDCHFNLADFYEPCASCCGHPCRDWPCSEAEEADEKGLVPDPAITRRRLLAAARDGREAESFIVMVGLGIPEITTPAFEYTPEMMKALAEMCGGYVNEEGVIAWAQEEEPEVEKDPYEALTGSFRLTVKELKAMVEQVAKFAPSRTIMPILNSVCFKCAGGRLELSSTDLDAYAVLDAVVNGQGKMNFILPAKELKEMIKRLKGTDITLSQDNLMVSLDDGRVNMKIKTMPIEDFPCHPENERKFAQVFCHENGEWRDTIGKAIITASKEDNRPVLEGVLCEYSEQINLASTDSYHLAVITMKGKTKGETSLLVPRDSLAKILKLKDKKSPVVVAASDDMARFTLGNINVYARLIEGRFPEWGKLIPDFDEVPCYNFELNRDETLAAIDAAGAASSTLVLELKETELAISGESRENNISTSTKVKVTGLEKLTRLPVEGEEEPPSEPGNKAAFSEAFLKDGIGMMGEKISVHLRDANRPMVMRSENVQFLLMPIKT